MEQLCEMVGKDGPNKSAAGSTTPSDTTLPRKSSIADWVSLRPRMPSEEEKQHWVFILRLRLHVFSIFSAENQITFNCVLELPCVYDLSIGNLHDFTCIL